MLCRRTDHGILRGRIVEVELYDGHEDAASHARFGRTPRNAPMFAAGGIAYVYLIYGVHHCLNVVVGESDWPAAVLIRAAETPRDGLSASGPGRLTRTFEIDRSHDGISLSGRQLWLEQGAAVVDRRVRRTARIGVDYAGAWARRRRRYVVRDHADLSGPRALR